MKINLESLSVRPVTKIEEPRYRELMQQHHYLGDLAKIGHTLWYVATYGEAWATIAEFFGSCLEMWRKRPLDWVELPASI